jgi:hypothetical protein
MTEWENNDRMVSPGPSYFCVLLISKKKCRTHYKSNFNNDRLASDTILDSELSATQKTTFIAVWSWSKEFFKFAQCLSSSAPFYVIKWTLKAGAERLSYIPAWLKIHHDHHFVNCIFTETLLKELYYDYDCWCCCCSGVGFNTVAFFTLQPGVSTGMTIVNN